MRTNETGLEATVKYSLTVAAEDIVAGDIVVHGEDRRRLVVAVSRSWRNPVVDYTGGHPTGMVQLQFEGQEGTYPLGPNHIQTALRNAA